MYFHPRMFDWSRERSVAAWQAFVDVWLDAVVRQQQAHVDALSVFCARKVERLKVLGEARDSVQFTAGLLSCAAPEPGSLTDLSARVAGIVGDTHRKVGEWVASQHDEMMALVVFETAAQPEKADKKASNGARQVPRPRAAA